MDEATKVKDIRAALVKFGKAVAVVGITHLYPPAEWAGIAVKLGLEVDAWTQSSAEDVKRWNDFEKARREAEASAVINRPQQ